MPFFAAGLRRKSIIPGFGLTLGFTVCYLSLIVLLPLAATFVETSKIGWHEFWRIVTGPRAVAAYGLSFGASLIAAGINFFLGTLVAWVLVRYQFPFKRILDSLVDLPFALPTAVAGIALTTIYAPNGFFGRPLSALGIHVAFTRLGIVVALTFIGLPFVVRTVQPILEDLDRELEEAAASLGASRWKTFTRVFYPAIAPAAITGFALGLCARRRRVRLGHLYRRQHADANGDRSAAYRHQTRGVRLLGRDGNRNADAAHLVRVSAGHQHASTVERRAGRGQRAGGAGF